MPSERKQRAISTKRIGLIQSGATQPKLSGLRCDGLQCTKQVQKKSKPFATRKSMCNVFLAKFKTHANIVPQNCFATCLATWFPNRFFAGSISPKTTSHPQRPLKRIDPRAQRALTDRISRSNETNGATPQRRRHVSTLGISHYQHQWTIFCFPSYRDTSWAHRPTQAYWKPSNSILPTVGGKVTHPRKSSNSILPTVGGNVTHPRHIPLPGLPGPSG